MPGFPTWALRDGTFRATTYKSSHIPGHVGPPESRGFYCPLGGQCPEMNVGSGLVECGGNVVHTGDLGDILAEQL